MNSNSLGKFKPLIWTDSVWLFNGRIGILNQIMYIKPDICTKRETHELYDILKYV